MKKNSKIIFALSDAIIVFTMMASIAGAVAYAHTKFAYRDEVTEIRKMVYDLWKNQNLHLKTKKK